MGAYQYQALKKSGATFKGVIEADSERHARQLLREQGMIPTHVHALKKIQTITHKNKLSSQDLALFTRQLSTLLAAGIPLEESLRGVSEQTEKDKTRQLIIGVRSKVLEGYSLAQAMAEYPYAFPELYRATVGAGEQTGRLDLVLEKLAEYTENQQQTRQKIQQALIYPTLMIVVSAAIISFLLAFVVPKIIEVFTSSGQSLPEMTKILINISELVKAYGLYLLIGFIALLIGFKRSLANQNVRMFWHRIMLKLPVVAYLVKSINVARYIHTFSILFAAGVNVLETMRVSASLINNLLMRNAFDAAAIRVREGTAIHQALKETGFLSPMAIHLIASGEKSGQLSPMMERAAVHLDNEVKRLIDTALTLLEPFIILLMGGVVLFIVLATLLPIFSMEQLVI
ncbi:GspF family T2SS innner membrane protein variant LspF [Legionella septentrionalis]|uniref:GspF family T2SS innner membrane protein variant LspF n=1 Tax=Legionella septentrionalis TaxID=2498109 RepID=UPI000F8E995A|nr:GspF family T2SS innner membrane protein variant LspF [Legionella septentrionalis]RUQ95133.1 type II secretion system protein GspF [Legionella septentrionalis]RUR08892.1 type II secretion system protein GspF [Legionella septentrionalis]